MWRAGKRPSVGIVTIFDCDNYGAELQAYALPQALRERGIEAFLIDYPFYKSPRFRRTALAAPSFPLSPINRVKERLMAWRRALQRRLAGEVVRRRSAAFAAFREAIPRTEPYLTFDALLQNPPPFDTYLTGSDQVWNPRMGATLRPYFLDFLPETAHRVAYAASFGVSTLPAAYETQVRRWLARYAAISCRERTGAALAARLCPDKDVAQVLDPTLLLPAEAYRALIRKEDVRPSGLVSYVLDENDEKQRMIATLKDVTGLSHTELLLFPFRCRCADPRCVSISEWLSALAEADFIVTDSFHGCVFSILFRKRFVAVGNQRRGLSRFLTLLHTFGLEDRLVLSYEEFEQKRGALMMAPDYENVHSRLAERREECLQWLRGQLS